MLMLADAIDRLFSMPLGLFVIFGAVGIVAIIFGCVTKAIEISARERTKREIAAYVAEGTIDADKALEMLRATGAGGKEQA